MGLQLCHGDIQGASEVHIAYNSDTFTVGTPEGLTANGLKVAGDVSQALVAAVLTVYIVYGIIGMFMKRPRETSIVGSSAKYAERLGGSKETAMQA